jgi:hypothetical protein
MRRHVQSAISAVRVAIAIVIVLASGQFASAQSPLFPNTTPVYNNPYGNFVSGDNGPFYRGVQFPLKPLPAAYSQPLPAPPPAVMAQIGPTPYAMGGTPNVRPFTSSATYPPAYSQNWAPRFSSR